MKLAGKKIGEKTKRQPSSEGRSEESLEESEKNRFFWAFFALF